MFGASWFGHARALSAGATAAQLRPKDLAPGRNGIEAQCREGYVTTDSATMDANMTYGPTSSDDGEDFWRSQMIMDAADEKASADLYPRLHSRSAELASGGLTGQPWQRQYDATSDGPGAAGVDHFG